MLAFSPTLPLNLRPTTTTTTQSTSALSSCPTRHLPSMGPWKKGEKDEAFRQQQEILARRRDKTRNRKYFQDVEDRRHEVEDNFQKRQLKVEDGVDPLIAWKKMKDDGLIDDAGYGEEEDGGIIIPMASFGIPKYDNGGRFDLKLPHVEHGYADPDADIMKKAGNAFKNMFGLGGNNKDHKSQ